MEGVESLLEPSRFTASCSVVVEALAGLLEVAEASLCRGEPHLSQVLPVEGTAAQLLALSLGLQPLDRQQLDVAGKRDSPGSQTPGDVPPHRPGPEQTQEKVTICVDPVTATGYFIYVTSSTVA